MELTLPAWREELIQGRRDPIITLALYDESGGNLPKIAFKKV